LADARAKKNGLPLAESCLTRGCLRACSAGSGTDYGMSALFALQAIWNDLETGHRRTVEGWDSLYSLSSAMLKGRCGDMTSCHFGNIQDELPKLAKTAGPFDFMFHDDGHSRETYIRDFNAVKEFSLQEQRYQSMTFGGRT
jgi:hypothetical protein